MYTRILGVRLTRWNASSIFITPLSWRGLKNEDEEGSVMKMHSIYLHIAQANSDSFGLNPHSQLVIGYRWLAFMNQVRKQSKT